LRRYAAFFHIEQQLYALAHARFPAFIAALSRPPGVPGPTVSGGEGSIVQFDNVGLRYGTEREVLSDVSFTLYPGSFYFLTGASGAGKTSLLRLLYLAQRPSRGVIRMFGTDTITVPRARLPAFRRRIGVVFLDFRLVPHRSAFDNVALPLRVSGVPESEIRKPVADMLGWVGLEQRGPALERPVREGGQPSRERLRSEARLVRPARQCLPPAEPVPGTSYAGIWHSARCGLRVRPRCRAQRTASRKRGRR
jgi:cell division transport system ATP-binding protein